MHLRQVRARVDEIHQTVFARSAAPQTARAYQDLAGALANPRVMQPQVVEALNTYLQQVQRWSQESRFVPGIHAAGEVGQLMRRVEKVELEGVFPVFSNLG